MQNPQRQESPLDEEPAGHGHALIGSLTRPVFYAQAARQTMGRSFAYLLMLVAVVWVTDAYHFLQIIKTGRQKVLAGVRDRLPTVRIENGVAGTDAPDLHVLYDTVLKGQKLIVAVDLAEELKLQDYEHAIVLRKTALVIRGGLQTRHISLSEIKALTVGPKEAEAFVHKVCDAAAILAIFLLPFYHFIAKVLTALFFTIPAAVVNRGGSRGYSYKALFQISLYALTPVVLLESLGHLAGRPLWFLGFVIGLVLCVLGTLARAAPRPRTV